MKVFKDITQIYTLGRQSHKLFHKIDFCGFVARKQSRVDIDRRVSVHEVTSHYGDWKLLLWVDRRVMVGAHNIFMRFFHSSTYTKRQVSCQPSLVRRHCSLLYIDKRLIVVFLLFQVSRWGLHRCGPMISQSHSAGDKKMPWKCNLDVALLKLLQTFFVQYIDGTGLPEALHSRVTAPPFRAVIWPLDGTARTLGGTTIIPKQTLLWSDHNESPTFAEKVFFI